MPENESFKNVTQSSLKTQRLFTDYTPDTCFAFQPLIQLLIIYNIININDIIKNSSTHNSPLFQLHILNLFYS